MTNLQAPPTRYRVEERDRRLIVIDSWSGSKVTHEHSHDPAARNLSIAMSTSPKPSQPLAASGTTPDILLAFAAFMTENRRDRRGRAVLKTRTFFDPAAPRYVALDQAGQRHLGQLGAALIGLIMFLFVLLMMTGIFFVAVAAIIGTQMGKPALSAILRKMIAQAEEVSASDFS